MSRWAALLACHFISRPAGFLTGLPVAQGGTVRAFDAAVVLARASSAATAGRISVVLRRISTGLGRDMGDTAGVVCCQAGQPNGGAHRH
jgi:hypothetical protein